VLRGLHRFDLQNLLVIANAILVSVGWVVVLLLGGGVVGLVLVNILVMLVLQVPTIWLIRWAAPELGYGWRGASRAAVGTVFRFSTWVFAVNIAGRVQTKTDEIVIGAFLPVSAVTPYALANKLSDVGLMLTEQFLKVLLPLASELHAGADRARLRALYLTSTRLTLAIFVPVGGTLAILAGPILSGWVGPAYADYAYVAVILVVADCIAASQWPAGSVLQAMVRHRPIALSAMAAALANLVLSILLLPSLGLAGVALGTLIPATVEAFGFVLPYTLRVVGVSLGEVLREVALPTLAPAVPMAGVAYGLLWAVAPTSLLAVAPIAALSVATYALVYLWLGARELEREACRGFASGTVRLIGGRLGRSSRRAA
jgi:O-antigen/teichoic acid export membrane protein